MRPGSDTQMTCHRLRTRKDGGNHGLRARTAVAGEQRAREMPRPFRSRQGVATVLL